MTSAELFFFWPLRQRCCSTATTSPREREVKKKSVHQKNAVILGIVYSFHVCHILSRYRHQSCSEVLARCCYDCPQIPFKCVFAEKADFRSPDGVLLQPRMRHVWAGWYGLFVRVLWLLQSVYMDAKMKATIGRSCKISDQGVRGCSLACRSVRLYLHGALSYRLLSVSL